MFAKTELALIKTAINDHMLKLQDDIHGDQFGEKKKQELEQKLIQYMAIYNKLLMSLPASFTDDVILTRITPVLVIEDSIVERALNVAFLKELGFSKVLEAKEGQQALALMGEYHKNGMPIGLVLCDWNMPNMSGLEFLKIVRRNRDLWQTPVYLVTGNHDKAHIVTAIKAGVSGYLVKPATLESFKGKLKPYLPKDKSK